MTDLISRYEEYQKPIFDDFGIKEGDKVLDVGYGDRSFPLATHAIDPIEDDKEKFYRFYPLQVLEGVKYYQMFIERTTFQDKYFDFVYCSHILDYLDKPEIACKELIRIGKAGYIETPTRFNEILFGQPSHQWIVENIGGKLVFQRKKSYEGLQLLTDLFYEAINKAKIGSGSKEYASRVGEVITYMRIGFPQLWYNMFKWKDNFEFEVIDE